MQKVRKKKVIESKVKKVEVIEQTPVYENLEEEVSEAELEEFAEFVTGMPSPGPGAVLESGQTLEEFETPGGMDAELAEQNERGTPVYDLGGGGGVYESGGRLYGLTASGEEQPIYEGAASDLPETAVSPTAGIAGSSQRLQSREIGSPVQRAAGVGESPVRTEDSPDRRYDMKEEAEGIRAKTDERHHRM